MICRQCKFEIGDENECKRCNLKLKPKQTAAYTPMSLHFFGFKEPEQPVQTVENNPKRGREEKETPLRKHFAKKTRASSWISSRK